MLEKKCNQGGHKSEGENCLQTHVGSWVDRESTTECEHNHSQVREHYESHSVLELIKPLTQLYRRPGMVLEVDRRGMRADICYFHSEATIEIGVL